MNVLIVHLGAESGEIRGVQLGGAIGARVRRKLHTEDLGWSDIVVLIKHAGPAWAFDVKLAGKPFAWDALDFWLQPDANGWTDVQARGVLRDFVQHFSPTVTICATQAMADACGGVYLPHHARPNQLVQPVREKVQVVAYEGVPKYLGKWRGAIEYECLRRGWQFLVNPPYLGYADIIVAFRDGQWDGWMCREWKSGVKIVNAMAVGRPIIMQPGAAFRELQPIGYTIESMRELSAAFDFYTPQLERKIAVRQIHDKQGYFTLPSIAEQYREILTKAWRQAA